MRRLLPPTLLLILGSGTACQTVGDEQHRGELTVSPSSAAQANSPLAAVGCPVPKSPCPEALDPVVCSALSKGGRPLGEEAQVIAWGSNQCLGLQNLAQEACLLGFVPSTLGQVQCVPDTSGGHCPPPESSCPKSQEPSVCTAEAYGDQALSKRQRIRGWGGNRCLAEASLRLAACRQNLDPIVLGKIHCEADATGGECPPKDTACVDLLRPTTCVATRAGGVEINPPIETRGASECAARGALARLACKLDIKPGALAGVSCLPD